MSKKKKKNNSNLIETVAAGAAVVGISAAVLRGAGGGARLTSTFNKFTHAFSKATTQIAADGFQKTNIHTVKRALGTFQDEFQNYNGKLFGSAMRGGLGDTIMSIKNSGRLTDTLIDAYATHKGVLELNSRYADNISDASVRKLRKNAINSVVQDAVHMTSLHQSDILDFRTTAARKLGDKGLFGSTETSDIITEALDMASYLKNKSEEHKYGGTLKSFRKVFDDISSDKRQEITDQIISELSDIDTLEKIYGSASKPTKKQTFFDRLLGDSQLTLEQVVEQYKRAPDEENAFMNAVVAEAEDLFKGKDGDRWKQLYWDSNLRINKDGDVYATDALRDVLKKADDFYNDTVIAKVLKTEEFKKTKQSPVEVSLAGSSNAIIEKIIGGTDSELSTQSYLFLHGKSFSFKDGQLIRHAQFDNKFETISDRSTAMRGYHKMFGVDADSGESRTIFDLHKSVSQGPIDGFVSRFTKFGDPKYGRNTAHRALQYNQINSSNAELMFETYSDLNKILLSSDRTISKGDAQRLADALRGHDDAVGSVFELLSKSDTELISELMNIDSASSRYHHLMDSGKADPSMFQSALKRMHAAPSAFLDNKHIIDGAINITGKPKAYTAAEYMRMMLSDEAMLKMRDAKSTISDPVDFIRNAIGGSEGKRLSDAFYSAQYINEFFKTDAYYRGNHGDKTIDILTDISRHMNDFLNSSKELQARQSAIRSSVNDTISLLQKGFNTKEYYTSQHTDKVFVLKGINPLDILRSLNDNTKNNATSETIKSFAKQFAAGTNSKENITTATYAPFFFVNRLMSDGIEKMGLGFSQDAYSSTANLVKNVLLKRVAPIVGGVMGLSYLNYEMDNIFGMSASEAFVSGVGNVDLAFRKFTDVTGLTSQLRGASVSNPLFSYWSNEQEFQSYEDRKEWYESGYTPVRQGRYWNFGSSSEFRGGKISYWQPSYVRRISSDYYNTSVYGSSEEKWKHSIIPTPRHPFSTIRYLMDPYWLEKKHYEDRPYPVTGKMFDETTPWGVVLNPTVGALIKPQRRMHQLELQGTTIDVRALIRKRNEEEKNKNASYYIGVGRNAVHSVEPVGGGEMSADYDVYYNGSNTAYYTPTSSGGSGNIAGAPVSALQYSGGNGDRGVNIPGPVEDISFIDKLQIASGSNPIAFAATTVLPMEQISQINAAIKQKGSSRGGGGYQVRSGYDSSRFTEVKSAIYSDTTQYDPTKKAFDEDAYMDNRSTEEWLRDVSYSAKELSGIYGFMWDTMFPPETKYTDAHAGAMTSFSARFWDEGIGGTGGSFMEIARRFIPHEDHSVKKINNIRNTMPEWLPERYRFGR